MNLTRIISEYILFLIFGTVFFQSIFFFLNLSIQWITLILATVSWLVFSWIYKDGKKINKENIVVVIIVWSIIVLLFQYFSYFHETTYDGGYYHGNAMVEMLNGWNPFYQADNYLVTGVTVWSDYYPKASWFFGAVLIRLFNHLSAGMILNALVALMTLGFTYCFVKKWKNSELIAIAAALVIFLNPIAIEQLHSYYIDAILGNLTIVLLILCAEIMDEYSLHNNILIIAVSVIMINLKFTGFGFAGLINLACWGMLFFKNRKDFFRYTISGVIMVILGVMIVGFSPYFINLIKMRHIFYPIAGKNAEDVVSYLIPAKIYGFNPIRKFIYSFFSGQEMMVNFKQFEQNGYLLYDERIGAMGLQFPKLVVLSAIGYLTLIYHDLRNRKISWIFWASTFALLLTIVANYKNVWWFRYIPQIWCIVPLGMILLYDSKWTRIFAVLSFSLVIYQCWPILENTVETDYAKSQSIQAFYDTYMDEEITISIRNHDKTEVYWFDAYEIARAKQEGVVIDEVLHGNKINDELPSYFMHSYKIWVIDKK